MLSLEEVTSPTLAGLRQARTLDKTDNAASLVMFQIGTSARAFALRRCCRGARARRWATAAVEIFALNGARQPMHQTLADFAGLSLGLELLGDLLPKLGPPLLLDRPGQAHQNGHLVVVQLQRRWHVRAAPCAGARTMTTRRLRLQEASEDTRDRPSDAPSRNSPAARAFGVLARRPGEVPRAGVGMSPTKAWRGGRSISYRENTAPAISPILEPRGPDCLPHGVAGGTRA